MFAFLTELPGPNIPLPCGYQAIAEHFAEGLDIRFGQRAKRVHYDASGVRVVCEGGAELRADAAVVTVSLGVLKVCTAVLKFGCVHTGSQQVDEPTDFAVQLHDMVDFFQDTYQIPCSSASDCVMPDAARF